MQTKTACQASLQTEAATQCAGKAKAMMIKVKKIRKKWRLVEWGDDEKSARIVKNEKGEPLDGGGVDDYGIALRTAHACNRRFNAVV